MASHAGARLAGWASWLGRRFFFFEKQRSVLKKNRDSFWQNKIAIDINKIPEKST
jgi:hypothetical protein